MEIVRSWGAVVVDSEQKFLLVQQSNGRHWSHPKGHPNPGETSFETAIREIREEGDVDVSLIEGFQIQEAWILPDGRRKEVVYYLGKRTDSAEVSRMGGSRLGMPTAKREEEEGLSGKEEILGRVWLTYHEALERITYEAGKRVLRKAAQFLKLRGMKV